MRNWKALMFHKLILKWIEILQGWLPKKAAEDVVLSLVLNCSALALEKGQYVEFAPIKGTCGNFRLSGNSLPTFIYTVFEKKLMEFVEVRVEISKPDRIEFFSEIRSTDKTTDGRELETKEKYKEPFWRLTNNLMAYFPFPMKGGRITNENQRQLDARSKPAFGT